MTSTGPGIVIVGMSVAATTAATSLREGGYQGDITLLGMEPDGPYARPPLSKGILTGVDSLNSANLPLGEGVAQLRTDAQVTGLHLADRYVTLAGGERVAYDSLVIASGARARTIAGPGPAQPIILRSLSDARRLRCLLEAGPRVLIVGGGVLGMELAATCRTRGLETTVISREPPLIDQLGPFLAALVVERALAAGTRIVVEPGLRFRGTDAITGVELDDGTVLEADVTIAAIGCTPNVEWLAGSGVSLSNGVVMDELCRVAPHVVAAGDVATVRHSDGTTWARTPNWTDAINQARTAAQTLLGSVATPYRRDPYFWTEGNGLSVRVAGALPAAGAPEIVDTAGPDGILAVWTAGGHPVTAAAVNYRIPVTKLKRMTRPGS